MTARPRRSPSSAKVGVLGSRFHCVPKLRTLNPWRRLLRRSPARQAGLHDHVPWLLQALGHGGVAVEKGAAKVHWYWRNHDRRGQEAQGPHGTCVPFVSPTSATVQSLALSWNLQIHSGFGCAGADSRRAGRCPGCGMFRQNQGQVLRSCLGSTGRQARTRTSEVVGVDPYGSILARRLKSQNSVCLSNLTRRLLLRPSQPM